jgi:hypothetical protein|tara:strand:+ start:1090 stop:1275 length:186 start_codon:yes stop_codon:yes gene_type:complete
MDKAVFEKGFNKGNLKDLEKTLHLEFEFNHDVGETQNKENFIKNIKSNSYICHHNENYKFK